MKKAGKLKCKNVVGLKFNEFRIMIGCDNAAKNKLTGNKGSGHPLRHGFFMEDSRLLGIVLIQASKFYVYMDDYYECYDAEILLKDTLKRRGQKLKKTDEYFGHVPMGYNLREEVPVIGKFLVKPAVFHSCNAIGIASIDITCPLVDNTSSLYRDIIHSVHQFEIINTKGDASSAAQTAWTSANQYALEFGNILEAEYQYLQSFMALTMGCVTTMDKYRGMYRGFVVVCF